MNVLCGSLRSLRSARSARLRGLFFVYFVCFVVPKYDLRQGAAYIVGGCFCLW